MMKVYFSVFSILFCFGIASCSHAQQNGAAELPLFRLPEMPSVLTTPEERATYLCLHYWDNFDFTDTTLISRSEITEQAFVDFIDILPYTPSASAAVDTLYCRAAKQKEMLAHFVLLGDKYLYEPNSPMHNEELYIMVLRSLINNPQIDDVDKIRPRTRLEMALKNHPGDVAADFAVVLRDGKRLQLSDIGAEYIILYFNDPDCEECQRTKQLLSLSATINGLLNSGILKLLSVCVVEDWDNMTLPTLWIDGYDEGQRLTYEQIYDLKAMPTLYLLDSQKRVILKDTSAEMIENWFDNNL